MNEKHKTGLGIVDSYFDRIAVGESARNVYDDWAENYNETSLVYRQLKEPIFDAINDFYSHAKNALILDVGAGTGYVGKKLQSMGFTNLDALEPSLKMLNQAISCGAYRRTYNNYIGLNQLRIADDTYDCVVSARCVQKNHIPASAIREVWRILKPEGIFALMGCYAAWMDCDEYHIRMENEITDLINSNRAEQLCRQLFDYYLTKDNLVHEGIMIILKKL